ncbi:Asp/Glu/hydantoin racemase [Arsenicitalea aurantiaca]|uniref:Asp/Glu/hydantoin racemase n=1 Tax=Arsenicitalea aurantiaca TaxID=1783274 RepID=A0A433XBI3_9HYPH|nr:aspartate/glutamate racemase family protein [Arsenicitalea aurantiaca]RUT31423.1 Asp/Glu/hydantoin racemase [Arsenicitalea aurantiaca]
MDRRLMGVLTPSSNTILEPATAALVANVPGVSAHFSRFTVTRIALSADANGQFEYAPMLAAARLLADARVGVIAWSGTSAAWLGSAWDDGLCAAIRAETGIPACTAVGAIEALLRKKGATRIGLISPYTDDVQHKIIENYAKAGITVIGEAHTGLSENFAFSTITDDAVRQMCRSVAASRPEALVIMCTNMRGWSLMAEIEAELGIPVVDSTAAVVWQGLDILGADASPIAGRGWMFGQTAGRG